MTEELYPSTPETQDEAYFEREETPKERWELVEEKANDLMMDTDELNELIHETGTLDDLSAFVRGDDDSAYAFKKRIVAAARAKAERFV